MEGTVGFIWAWTILGCTVEPNIDDNLPPTEIPPDPTIVPPAIDADGDGHAEDVDCRDDDPTIHPGAPELCDLVDSDCSGSGDVGIVTHFLSSGDAVDLTAQLEGGVVVSGGSVVFCPGIYDLGTGSLQVAGVTELRGIGLEPPVVTSSGAETLYAAAGSDLVVRHLTLTGTGTSLVDSDGSDVVLERVVLDGANVTTLGNLTNAGDIVLYQTEIRDSTYSDAGLQLQAEAVDLLDVTISGTRTPTGAAALEIVSSGSVVIRDLTVDDSDGGLRLEDIEEVTADDVAVLRQTGPFPALRAVALPNAQFTGLTLEDNAQVGLLVEGRNGTYTNLTVRDALVTGQGSHGIHVDGGDLVAQGASLYLSTSTVAGNGRDNVDDGGGIRIDGTFGYASLDTVTIEGNTAPRGAGIAVAGGFVYGYDSALIGNEATISGGAVYYIYTVLGNSSGTFYDTGWGAGKVDNGPNDVLTDLGGAYDYSGIRGYVSCSYGGCN